MDNMLNTRWLKEVAQQCRFVRLAHSELRSNLVAFEPDRTFLFVHSLLSHARDLAQLVWPEHEDLKPHGETLRAECQADEASPLRREAGRKGPGRSDANYRGWLDRVGSGGFVETNIMPRGSLGDFKSDVFQRDLDPETLDFRFRGEQWDLDALADEAVKIEKAVTRLLSRRRQL